MTNSADSKPRIWIAVALIVAAVALRLLPHPPNFSPVAAIALFAGAHFLSWRLAVIVPFVALFLSDLVLGLHDTMVFVYAAMAITVVIGRWIAGRGGIAILGAASAGSASFFLMTNIGVWATGALYPMTGAGLVSALVAGIPFFQYTVLGDLIYVAVLFGGFALVTRYALQPRGMLNA